MRVHGAEQLTVDTLEDGASDYPPISFTCPPLPPITRHARNVYELRPQDIKVVMALGDSITAGKSSQLLYSYREYVHSSRIHRVWNDGLTR